MVLVSNIIKDAAGAILVSAMAIVFGHMGCTQQQAKTAGPIITESAYTAELLACVQKYDTRKDVDQCRRDADARFGVTYDAGVDGGK
jgi:hypothetical protein